MAYPGRTRPSPQHTMPPPPLLQTATCHHVDAWDPPVNPAVVEEGRTGVPPSNLLRWRTIRPGAPVHAGHHTPLPWLAGDMYMAGNAPNCRWQQGATAGRHVLHAGSLAKVCGACRALLPARRLALARLATEGLSSAAAAPMPAQPRRCMPVGRRGMVNHAPVPPCTPVGANATCNRPLGGDGDASFAAAGLSQLPHSKPSAPHHRLPP